MRKVLFSPTLIPVAKNRRKFAQYGNRFLSGAGLWNAEVLIQCKPDVIITTYTADVSDDIQRQTGIPVVSVTELSEMKRLILPRNTAKTSVAWAKYVGVSERAES